jgi:hypothetical protein
MSRAGLRARRGAVLLAVLTLTALPPVGAGAATPTPPSTEDSPVEVLVTKLAPHFLSDPDQFVQVTGRLTNTGSAAVSGLSLRLMRGERLDSRQRLAQADEEPPELVPVATSVRPVDDVLAPGASTTFDLSLRVRELDLGPIGVYPFGVRVRGTVDGVDERSSQVGLVQTYLPWFPDGAPRPTRVAWLWPLADAPTRAPREVLVDESLPQSLASGGRLSQLVVGAAAGGAGKCPDRAVPPAGATATAEPAPCTTPRPVPLTYAVDPDLLFSASALATSPYRVLEGDEAVDRDRSEDAERWLASLRDDLALDRTDLLLLPYADPDAVALAGDVALDTDLVAARGLSTAVARDVLGDVPVLDVAWPPPGPLTARALDALVGPSTRAVVLDERALPPPVGETLTRDTRAALSTSATTDLTGLVVDDGLSRLLEPGPATAGKGPRLAEQRWLAESAMVVAEAPSRSRTLVVAPPRRGTVPQSVASAVIADTGRVPWLCPVSLRDVVAGRDACPGEAGPDEPRTPELVGALESPADTPVLVDRGYRDVVERVRAAGEQLTDEVLDPSEDATATRSRLLRARLRTESSAWEQDPRGGRRLLSLLQDDVRGLREQVVVRTAPKITLTSDRGTIRVNLSNALQQPVTVKVRLTAPAARLSVGTTPEVTVPPQSVIPVDLQVEALVSGQFVVEAQLLDRAGRPFGDPRRVVVRSTRYGRVALALTGLGAAGLLVAAGVRITRRALRRPEDPDAAPASSGTA